MFQEILKIGGKNHVLFRKPFKLLGKPIAFCGEFPKFSPLGSQRLEAQTLQGMARNPEAMQGWLQLRAAVSWLQIWGFITPFWAILDG